MDKNKLVRMELLKRKIDEYWNKHPKAKATVFIAEAGDSKTFWHVSRNKNQFTVKEVKTITEQFIFEQGGTKADRPVPRPQPATGTASAAGDVPFDQRPTGPIPGETTAQRKARMAGQAGFAGAELPAARVPQAEWDDWAPLQQFSVGQGNKFFQAMRQSGGDLKRATAQMPPGVFAHAFRKWGIQSPNQITPQIDAQIKQQYGIAPPARQSVVPQASIPPTQMTDSIEEASPQFTTLSRDFQDAMTSMSAGEKDMASKIATARKRMETGASRLQDPFEITQASAMVGALTGASDATTKFSDPSKTGVKIQGENKEKMLAFIKVLLKEMVLLEQPPPAPASAPEAPGEPAGQAGLETAPVTPQPEMPTATPKPDDEAMVGEQLSNKSLGTASFNIEPGSTKLTMEILGVQNPAVLEHRRDGTVVWQFRGQTKMFRPEGGPPEHKKKAPESQKSKPNERKPSRKGSESPKGTEKPKKSEK